MPELLRAIEAFTNDPSYANQERMYALLRGRDESSRLQSAVGNLDPALRSRDEAERINVPPGSPLDEIQTELKGPTLENYLLPPPAASGGRGPRSVRPPSLPVPPLIGGAVPVLDLDDIQGRPSIAAQEAGPYKPVLPRRSVVPAPETLADVLRTAGMRPEPDEADDSDYDPRTTMWNPTARRRERMREQDRTRSSLPSIVRAPAPSLVDSQGRVRDRAEVRQEAEDEFAHLTERDFEAERADRRSGMQDDRSRAQMQRRWDRTNSRIRDIEREGGTIPSSMLDDEAYYASFLNEHPDTQAFMASGGVGGDIDRTRARSRFRTAADRPMGRPGGGGLYGALADPATQARRDELMIVRDEGDAGRGFATADPVGPKARYDGMQKRYDLRGGGEYVRSRPGSDDGFNVKGGRRPLRVDLSTVGRRKVRMKKGDRQRLKQKSNDYWKQKYEADPSKDKGLFPQWMEKRKRSGMKFRVDKKSWNEHALRLGVEGEDFIPATADDLPGYSSDQVDALNRSAQRSHRRGLKKSDLNERKRRAQYLRSGRDPRGITTESSNGAGPEFDIDDEDENIPVNAPGTA